MSDNKETAKKTPKVEEDQELADLLNSALEDFSKEAEKPAGEAQKAKQNKESEKETEQPTDAVVETEWTEEFIRQAAEQFESNIANILREAGGPEITTDQVQQSFQRMAEAAAQAVTNTGETGNDDFASSISQALRGLSEGTENLQNPFSDHDIMSMFGQADGDQNTFVPFMQGMMQSLLSKEVLYPSLKEILNKYPSWMEANGGSLSVEERHKYEKQQEIMKQVCDQLEKESESHTPEQKKTQFESVLALMQKLQDYGQPPPELVGDLGPGLAFDAQGNPDLNQCTLM